METTYIDCSVMEQKKHLFGIEPFRKVRHKEALKAHLLTFIKETIRSLSVEEINALDRNVLAERFIQKPCTKQKWKNLSGVKDQLARWIDRKLPICYIQLSKPSVHKVNPNTWNHPISYQFAENEDHHYQLQEWFPSTSFRPEPFLNQWTYERLSIAPLAEIDSHFTRHLHTWVWEFVFYQVVVSEGRLTHPSEWTSSFLYTNGKKLKETLPSLKTGLPTKDYSTLYQFNEQVTETQLVQWIKEMLPYTWAKWNYQLYYHHPLEIDLDIYVCEEIEQKQEVGHHLYRYLYRSSFYQTAQKATEVPMNVEPYVDRFLQGYPRQMNTDRLKERVQVCLEEAQRKYSYQQELISNN